MSIEDYETPRIKLKGRPSLDEAAAIDRAIKEAALSELLQKGEAATINAVAQAAGLSRKTVYARYSNKTELFREAVREVLNSVEPLTFSCEGALVDVVANYVFAIFELLEKPYAKTFQQAIAMEPGPISELAPEFTAATYTIFFAPLAAFLNDAQARGDIRANEDIRELTRLIMTTALIIGRAPDEDNEGAWTLKRRSREYAMFMSRVFVSGFTAS